ncbi:hypothetical protein AB4560_20380, partial [Vibrio sp. 10N.222.51.C12]
MKPALNRENILAVNLNKFIIVVWLTVSFISFTNEHSSILIGALGDSDNYMRLYQVLSFLEEPQLRQSPLERFNPEDGRILHWSRLVDLPIAGVLWLSNHLMNQNLSIAVTVFIVPSFYFLLLICSISQLTKSLFGVNVAYLSVMCAPFSIAYAKFAPGYIDHHNLQLILFALFLGRLPVNKLQCRSALKEGCISGSIVALSVLIGLEGIPGYFFAMLLTLYFLSLQKGRNYTWKYLASVGLSFSCIGMIGLSILEPLEAIISPHYDTASFPLFLLSFLVGLSFLLNVNTCSLTKTDLLQSD